MKKIGKTAAWIASVLFTIALVLSIVLYTKSLSEINALQSKNADLNLSIEERDSIVNELAETFDEIENNLTFINEKKKQMLVESDETKGDRKKRIVSDIKLMDDLLAQSSEKIKELEEKLKNRGFSINNFQTRINQLTSQINNQDEIISKLDHELKKRDYAIAELDLKLAGLEFQIIEMEDDLGVKTDSIKMAIETIEKQEKEINTTYFASGTFEELEENGLATQDKKLFGLIKNKTLRDDLNKDHLVEIDKRNIQHFPVFSKNADILSHHPDSSYRFLREGDQITFLEIENPDEFWQFTKYAIVETK